MNVVQEIRRINQNELQLGLTSTASWHDEYKDSAYIFIGGLPFELTEGDVICVFSQYGEIVNINLVRDKESGKSKGYGFLQYEDQRSTILAVDNLNGTKLLGRVLRVDHVKNYRQPKQGGSDELPSERVMNAAPQPISNEPDRGTNYSEKKQQEDDDTLMLKAGIDPEDPMAEYYLKKYKRRMKRKEKQERSGGQPDDNKRQRHRRSHHKRTQKHREKAHSRSPSQQARSLSPA